MCCISKLQVDRDFWPVLYLRYEVQEYKTKAWTKIEKCLIQSYVINVQLLSNVTHQTI